MRLPHVSSSQIHATFHPSYVLFVRKSVNDAYILRRYKPCQCIWRVCRCMIIFKWTEYLVISGGACQFTLLYFVCSFLIFILTNYIDGGMLIIFYISCWCITKLGCLSFIWINWQEGWVSGHPWAGLVTCWRAAAVLVRTLPSPHQRHTCPATRTGTRAPGLAPVNSGLLLFSQERSGGRRIYFQTKECGGEAEERLALGWTEFLRKWWSGAAAAALSYGLGTAGFLKASQDDNLVENSIVPFKSNSLSRSGDDVIHEL